MPAGGVAMTVERNTDRIFRQLQGQAVRRSADQIGALKATAGLTPLQAALALTAKGISVTPVRADGSKAAGLKWKEFTTRIMTEDEVRTHFAGNVGIAIICGAVSGNLEVIDIEGHAPWAEIAELIEETAPGLLAYSRKSLHPPAGAISTTAAKQSKATRS
jgi:hypothetical protein